MGVHNQNCRGHSRLPFVTCHKQVLPYQYLEGITSGFLPSVVSLQQSGSKLFGDEGACRRELPLRDTRPSRRGYPYSIGNMRLTKYRKRNEICSQVNFSSGPTRVRHLGIVST